MRVTWRRACTTGTLCLLLASVSTEAVAGPFEPPPATEAPERLAPGRALAMALSGTALGWGAMLLSSEQDSDELGVFGLIGVVAGPSLGQHYAGAHGRALAASGARLGGGVLILAGFVKLMDRDLDYDDGPDVRAGKALLYGGAILGAGATLYSIVDAPLAARRANRRARRELAVAPAVLGDGPARRAYGLQLAMTF